MKNDQDIFLLESLLVDLGVEVDLNELKRLPYDTLTDEAKSISQELMRLLNITQDQIQPASPTNIVIYDDFRSQLIDKLEDNGGYGPKRHPRQGNFKKGDVVITKLNSVVIAKLLTKLF